jgi:hypothetical protein
MIVSQHKLFNKKTCIWVMLCPIRPLKPMDDNGMVWLLTNWLIYASFAKWTLKGVMTRNIVSIHISFLLTMNQGVIWEGITLSNPKKISWEFTISNHLKLPPKATLSFQTLVESSWSFENPTYNLASIILQDSWHLLLTC